MRAIRIDCLYVKGDALHILQVKFHTTLQLFIVWHQLTFILEAHILYLLTCRLQVSSLCHFCHFLVKIPKSIMLIALIYIIR